MKKADSGRLGALGSLPAFFDEPEAPRGIFEFISRKERSEDESEEEENVREVFN